MSVSIKLKKAREESNLKQAHVSTHLEICQSTLSKLENGNLPLTVDMLIKFARLVNKPVSSFFSEEEWDLENTDQEKIELLSKMNELLESRVKELEEKVERKNKKIEELLAGRNKEYSNFRRGRG